jgi:adenine-specific DNA-methyltransferase
VCGTLQFGYFYEWRAVAIYLRGRERGGYDLVYLNPPHAPSSDDNCYNVTIFRRGAYRSTGVGGTSCITKTKKLTKRFTLFSHKHTVTDAIRQTIKRFGNSAIVLSYSSNAVPDARTIGILLRDVKNSVEIREVDSSAEPGSFSGDCGCGG